MVPILVLELMNELLDLIKLMVSLKDVTEIFGLCLADLFILIFKPTIRYFENGRETVKGNVDAELVLHASAIEFDNYDKAIIVSGDGDFACLVEYLDEQGKLLKVMTPNAKYSKLLKPFSTYIIQINKLKKSLEYKKASIGGRSKP